MAEHLAWGIIGTGNIAAIFAKALPSSRTGRLVAVGSRTAESAQKFGEQFSVPHRHASYEALLADPQVQAVYISTPHPMHAEWAIKAAQAGKHILCEKPLTLNHAEAVAVIEAARRHDVFLMEAFMYRCHPQTAKIVELIRSGALGQVRVVQASFSYNASVPLEHRVFNNALGGGGIMDIGCYCMSMARLVAGVAQGKEFAEPEALSAYAKLHEVTGVDEWAVASLRFPGDILAQLSTGVSVAQENCVRIYGSGGSLHVLWPWNPDRSEGGARLLYYKGNMRKQPEEIIIADPAPLYSIEADTVAANIERRQAPSPAMTWADSLGNMMALDRWRNQVGVVFDAETISG